MRETTSKRTVLLGLFILIVAGSMGFKLVKANFFMPPNDPAFHLDFPQDDVTYVSSTICPSFTLEHNLFSTTGYMLDGGPLVPIQIEMVSKTLLIEYQDGLGPFYRYTSRGDFVLSNLTEGFHYLKLCTFVTYDWRPDPVITSSITAYFEVNTLTPCVQILSPNQPDYNTSYIPLVFIAAKLSTFKYAIDEQANITIAGNLTLTGLGDGSHCLIIYGKDAAENTEISDKVWFNVKTKSSVQTPTPTPTTTPTPQTGSPTSNPSIFPVPSLSPSPSPSPSPTITPFLSSAQPTTPSFPTVEQPQTSSGKFSGETLYTSDSLLLLVGIVATLPIACASILIYCQRHNRKEMRA